MYVLELKLKIKATINKIDPNEKAEGSRNKPKKNKILPNFIGSFIKTSKN